MTNTPIDKIHQTIKSKIFSEIILFRLGAYKVILTSNMKERFDLSKLTFKAAMRTSASVTLYREMFHKDFVWTNFPDSIKKSLIEISQNKCVDEGLQSISDMISREEKSIQYYSKLINEMVENNIALDGFGLFVDIKLFDSINWDNRSKHNVDSYARKKERGFKILTGPKIKGESEIFDSQGSIVERIKSGVNSDYGETPEGYWQLAHRETIAGLLCALNVIEYDNMPFEFYYDMLKQLYDELKHSIFYLEYSINVISGNSNYKDVQTIASNGKITYKLPVPKENDFYFSFLNANLIERLVLMQLDAEGVSIKGRKKKLKSNTSHLQPPFLEGLHVDLNDEISHARYGYKWLKHILPNKERRLDEIEQARQMKSLLFLASISHKNNEDINSTFNQIIS